jgi:hypothetical protein
VRLSASSSYVNVADVSETGTTTAIVSAATATFDGYPVSMKLTAVKVPYDEVIKEGTVGSTNSFMNGMNDTDFILNDRVPKNGRRYKQAGEN